MSVTRSMRTIFGKIPVKAALGGTRCSGEGLAGLRNDFAPDFPIPCLSSESWANSPRPIISECRWFLWIQGRHGQPLRIQQVKKTLAELCIMFGSDVLSDDTLRLLSPAVLD